MSIKIIKGSLLSAPLNRVLCHQVNCQGAMGSGVAKAIRQAYPEVYEFYLSVCNYDKVLGRTFVYYQEGKHDVANLFAQNNFGRVGVFTDYDAFQSCIDDLVRIAPNRILAFPYKIGCGLGGGDWDIIIDILENIPNEVELYKI